MDEIRVCASLDHPKVVTFLGFTFSSLADLAVVLEHMPHGDLASLLHKQLQRETRDPVARDAYGWFHSTRANGRGLKCRSLIALDIAEAMAYLPSFESPIIHRDLKPKNVLLSDTWEAKLTDFGISRERSEDLTMTAEMGTISWIAPGVLRGERWPRRGDGCVEPDPRPGDPTPSRRDAPRRTTDAANAPSRSSGDQSSQCLHFHVK